ncbi:MAG: radical SAM family heme chaperone HemW [Proteobacteria bacterium]|nr:radical SAM family heme chaperone HemW [Pseudomonadota bacterium]
MDKDLAIYVHWPWCKAKCPYCDFNSHALEQAEGGLEEAYVAALGRELAGWKEKLGGTRRVTSVFFGGGTPSLMGVDSVARVLNFCADLGGDLTGAEITVEANPTSASKTLFKGLAEAGVNRFSVGVQGLREEWLEFLGRKHAVHEALQTLEDAMEACGNVNADVIYGLPGQQLEDWTQQLEKLGKMGLTHLSAYQLTIEKNTRFFSDVRRGLWTPVDSDTEADFFAATQATLAGLGYENYEISNFSKPGKACAHNLHVWRYGDYLGVGAGAHGRVTLPDGHLVATAVVRQPQGYLTRMGEAGEALAVEKRLDAAEAMQEAVFSGLRLAAGIDTAALRKRFGKGVWGLAVDDVELARLEEGGLLRQTGTILALSENGWPKLDGILRRILPRLGEAV